MYSDVDINEEIQARKTDAKLGIAIKPFNPNYLTPVGYDLSIGIKGFSWEKKSEIDIENEGKIEIEPNDTVVVETLESISLSKQVGATIHSMATRAVLQGLSHISTTIDPGWNGKLLISFHNYKDTSVELRFKDSFCTVCFYRVESESQVSLGRPPDRVDLWQNLIEVARQERKRQEKDLQIRESKKKQEERIRNILLVGFIIIAGSISHYISANKPEYGASFAAFLALFAPIIYKLLEKLL
ncbi:MAG: hypothetical protein WBB28_12795 [Crinalium sp.]